MDLDVAATLEGVEPVQREDVATMFGTSPAMVWQWMHRGKDSERATPAPINPGGAHVWDRADWAAWGILTGRTKNMSKADLNLGRRRLRERAKAQEGEG